MECSASVIETTNKISMINSLLGGFPFCPDVSGHISFGIDVHEKQHYLAYKPIDFSVFVLIFYRVLKIFIKCIVLSFCCR